MCTMMCSITCSLPPCSEDAIKAPKLEMLGGSLQSGQRAVQVVGAVQQPGVHERPFQLVEHRTAPQDDNSSGGDARLCCSNGPGVTLARAEQPAGQHQPHGTKVGHHKLPLLSLFRRLFSRSCMQDACAAGCTRTRPGRARRPSPSTPLLQMLAQLRRARWCPAWPPALPGKPRSDCAQHRCCTAVERAEAC